tara:strand:- start:1060 stop:1941 length:882 start_codon:yes stop_codon:yes gene_type:complete
LKNSLQIWLLAFRLKTLPAAIAPIIIGLSYAYQSGIFNPFVAFFTLLASILIQIGTNLANDVFDFEKGTDTEERLGPKRVTQAGLLTSKQVKKAMIISFLLALLIGLYLSLIGGWPIVIIGSFAIISGIAYTGGPYPLGYHGLGDLFVFIFFGIVAVPGTFYLQGGELFDSFAIILGIIMGLMADCILIVNNIRDADNDIKTGKNTLTVIFGKKISKLQYSIFVIIPYLFPFWIFQNMVPKLAIFIVLFSFPICIRSIIDIWYKSGKSLNIVLENTARLQFIYSILLSFGFII